MFVVVETCLGRNKLPAGASPPALAAEANTVMVSDIRQLTEMF